MVAYQTRVAQLWPRAFVGIWSVSNIYDTIAATFHDPQVLTSKGFHLDSFLLSHKDDPEIPDTVCFSIVATLILIDLASLYAAVHRSVPATKFSLAIFWFRIILSAVLLMSDVVKLFLDGTVLKNFLPLVLVFGAFTEYAIFGYSLVVMLRDFRGQPRDKLGRLLAESESGVFDEEVSSTPHGPLNI
ncbi:hypothetical protein EDD21DRAFT_403699 [Dissophora ornata]|nr:hypothetical protein BGZ58_010456 [Dissophora ornata]KAI8602380.1 hypothetical protein EDD21DRAFT_403699 [Dissophora ornata]